MPDRVTRTFKPRRRRLSPSRAAALEDHGPQFTLETRGDELDLSAVFGRDAPVVLEIGIGAGEALLEMTAADHATDVIGCDVHTPGIAAVLKAIVAEQRTNIRLVHGDVLEFLTRLPDASLAGIRIFFPDPWPKPSQRWRRLVTAPHLDRLVPKLAPGGVLHMATDIADYADQMADVAGAHPELAGGPVDRPPTRPMTRYERKGLTAGRSVTDLMYHRVPPGVTSGV